MEFDRMGVEEIKQSIREKLENNFGCGLSDATTRSSSIRPWRAPSATR